MNRHPAISFAAILLALLITACAPVRDIRFRQLYRDVDELMVHAAIHDEKPYLKAHLQNGDVMLFTGHWEIDTARHIIRGYGSHYDFNRRLRMEDTLHVATDKIALLETNVLPENKESHRMAVLYFLGAANFTLSTICLVSPKTCFGSCPTFYIADGPALDYANAEAFSDAIAPALEYRDIDALRSVIPGGAEFTLTMKNEAFETHMVRSADILAVPLTPGTNAYHSPDDRFFITGKQQSPLLATADEGDITWLLAREDQNERLSLSDSVNMRSNETIFLYFENMEEVRQTGLALGFRQSLMTTFLLYNAIDYMGHMAGDFLAGLSHLDGRGQSIGDVLKNELGGINVYLWHSGPKEWVFQGSFYETGPIAINHQMLPLSQEAILDDTIMVKLELNRGMWRLDYLMLTEIIKESEPLVIRPAGVSEGGRAGGRHLEYLLDDNTHLVSTPGDVYRIRYELPADYPEYALFLAAKGYYLIWNREEWLREKDLRSLYQMRYHPRRYLRRQAEAYKEYEKTMEDLFWKSRVNQQIITGHD